MLVRVIMPQGGQDIENATVVRWAKSQGESVKKGELLCEVETEKAVFEVESPSDGFLTKIVAQSGSAVPILSVIAWVGTEAGDRAEEALELGPAAAETEILQTVHALSTPHQAEDRPESPERILITPRAKKLATEMGIRPETVRGTGPRHRILEKDILEAAERQGQVSPDSAEPPVTTSGLELVPLGKVGKAMFRRMQQSKREIPHFYISVSVDMGRSLDLREQLNATAEAESALSVNDLIVRACALALGQMPEINRFVYNEEALVQRKDINIGVATALADGLVVPVLENVQDIPLLELGRKTRALIDAARRGKQPSLAQAGLTISNLGMFGAESFQAIINPPEAAILAVGKIDMRVVAVDDRTTAIRPMMTMTFSVDHRVIDGVRAARFLGCIKSLLEAPEGLS